MKRDEFDIQWVVQGINMDGGVVWSALRVKTRKDGRCVSKFRLGYTETFDAAQDLVMDDMIEEMLGAVTLQN